MLFSKSFGYPHGRSRTGKQVDVVRDVRPKFDDTSIASGCGPADGITRKHAIKLRCGALANRFRPKHRLRAHVLYPDQDWMTAVNFIVPDLSVAAEIRVQRQWWIAIDNQSQGGGPDRLPLT